MRVLAPHLADGELHGYASIQKLAELTGAREGIPSGTALRRVAHDPEFGSSSVHTHQLPVGPLGPSG